MNLPRIFANAVARRVAYVFVAVVLAWLGFGGDARAQSVNDALCNTASYRGNDSTADPVCSSREVAYHSFEAAVEHFLVENPIRWREGTGVHDCGAVWCRYRQRFGGLTGYRVTRWYPASSECPSGFAWDDDAKTCGLPCDGKDPIPATSAHAPGDSNSFCANGCAYSCDGGSILLTIDGQLRTVCAGSWNTSGTATCSASEVPEPIDAVADSDGDGTSDENDLSPNNPGESGDGSGQDVSRACGGPGQPECAADGSNEGSGKGNTSGGGGDCNTPPRSSGDAILAQIAFQTWATRCAVQATANQGTGTGTGPGAGDDDGQPDWTKGDGPPVATDETDYVSDQTQFELPISTDLLDQENIFGASSCPNFSVTVWGQTVSTAEWDHWCTLANILRVMVGLFGAMTAIKILLGKW